MDMITSSAPHRALRCIEVIRTEGAFAVPAISGVPYSTSSEDDRAVEQVIGESEAAREKN